MISAAKFAQDTGISLKTAKRILDVLYEKELDAKDLSSVLWRVREWFIRNKMPELVEKMGKSTIGDIVDEMIADRARYEVPGEIACCETDEELEAAFNNLEEDKSAWFFSALDFKDKKKGEFKAGDEVTIQIMRTGKWNHQIYGQFEVTKKTLKEVKKNFEDNKRGIDLAVDENHEEDHKALAWFKQLTLRENDTALDAKIELTQKGADLLNEGAYKYFSPEIAFVHTDEESGEKLRNLLLGGAFTNRPFFKNMQPLTASEVASDNKTTDSQGPTLLLFYQPNKMETLLRLIAQFSAKKVLTKAEKEEIEKAFKEVPADKMQPEIKKAFTDIVARYSEDGSAPAEGEGGDEGGEGTEGEGEGGDAAPAEGEGEGTEGGDEGGEGGSEGGDLPEGVEANEDGSFTVDAKFMESVKGIQKNVSKLQRESRKAKFTEELKRSKFSEANQGGVILPKNFEEVVDFALSLSEKQGEKFVALVKKFKSVGGAIGFNAEDDTPVDPAKLTEADPMVKHFMEKLGQDVDKAKQSAKYYYEEKAKQNR